MKKTTKKRVAKRGKADREAWDVFVHGPYHGRMEPATERGNSVVVPVINVSRPQLSGMAMTYRCKHREIVEMKTPKRKVVIETRVWLMDAADVRAWREIKEDRS